jgi:hypothetical protein
MSCNGLRQRAALARSNKFMRGRYKLTVAQFVLAGSRTVYSSRMTRSSAMRSLSVNLLKHIS